MVDDSSSYLNLPDIETTEHIIYDHRDMCRFSGRDDTEYKKVAAALRRMAASVARKHNPSSSPSLSEQQRLKLQKSLGFGEIDAGQLSINCAHSSACNWRDENRVRPDWLDRDEIQVHRGFLWVRGKPETGESNLMKNARDLARDSMKDVITICLCSNACGEDLEKSLMGMYRSLLLQLVSRLPELGPVVYTASGLASWSGRGEMRWTVETLRDLLRKALEFLAHSNLVLFINALDECDEGRTRDIVSCLQQAGEPAMSFNESFRVYLFSQRFPRVTVNHAREIAPTGQNDYDRTITNYIYSELKMGQSKFADEIKAEIRARASGVFPWAALVVGILNREYERGRISALRKRLREAPIGLHELFHYAFLPDSRDPDELVFVLRFMISSRRPLNPEDFYFGVLAHTNPELGGSESESIPLSTLRRFVLDCSEGLAYVTESEPPIVEFIHESVRDFFLQDGGLRGSLPGFTRQRKLRERSDCQPRWR